MKCIVSVAKTYIHSGNPRHKSETKKRSFIYYYDEDFHFRMKKNDFG